MSMLIKGLREVLAHCVLYYNINNQAHCSYRSNNRHVFLIFFSTDLKRDKIIRRGSREAKRNFISKRIERLIVTPEKPVKSLTATT